MSQESLKIYASFQKYYPFIPIDVSVTVDYIYCKNG